MVASTCLKYLERATWYSTQNHLNWKTDPNLCGNGKVSIIFQRLLETFIELLQNLSSVHLKSASELTLMTKPKIQKDTFL